MKYLIIILFLLLLTHLCINNSEKFSTGFGVGRTFGFYHQPRPCLPEFNCFKGAYWRSQAYHNVCPPKFGGLNREKIQLQDDCSRTLGPYPNMKPKYEMECRIDKHLNRHCKWKQNYLS